MAGRKAEKAAHQAWVRDPAAPGAEPLERRTHPMHAPALSIADRSTIVILLSNSITRKGKKFMDEQSLNDSQPKVRRAKSGWAEEPQPSETPPESPDQLAHEALENAPGILTGRRRGEHGDRQRHSPSGKCAPLAFKATQHALEEWTHFFGRATERNFRATDDLSECHSITGLLQWQGNLIQSNVEDWLQTSFSVFSVSARKFFSYQTQ